MAEAWEVLFDQAVACLDSCRNAIPPWARWSLGGGTALMLHLHHRRSRDIDVFLNDVQMLGYLSPRVNAFVENLAQDYVEAANYIKLTLPEGEIDFIAAPFLTAEPWRKVSLRGRRILLETPAEIVFKKLFYRAETLQTRDVFDAAAVIHRCRSVMDDNAEILMPKLDVLVERLQHIRNRYERELSSILDVSPDWKPLLYQAPEVLAAFFETLRRRRNPSDLKRGNDCRSADDGRGR